MSGSITCLRKIALPDDAVITVQIQDTSLVDAPATVMGEQVIKTKGEQVLYDVEAIRDNHTYTM